LAEVGIDYVAEVERELAALDAGAEQLPARDRRRRTGPSLVYSVRLDVEEVEALERRAAALNLRPSVLARSLIRVGLSSGGTDAVSRLIDQLESTLAELRDLVP
jgi:chemotaxis response regulator CheB